MKFLDVGAVFKEINSIIPSMSFHYKGIVLETFSECGQRVFCVFLLFLDLLNKHVLRKDKKCIKNQMIFIQGTSLKFIIF